MQLHACNFRKHQEKKQVSEFHVFNNVILTLTNNKKYSLFHVTSGAA